MVYNLGAVGLGHWIKRLNFVLEQSNDIRLVKAVGTRRFDDKKEELEKYSIGRENYFQINNHDPLPEEFFSNLDIVHIASPNQFHQTQAMQSLSHHKLTVVEKTFASNNKDFDKFVSFVRQNNHENKVILHLHYLTKALTLELQSRLHEIILQYGKISGICATFFEKTSDEDARRKWLYRKDSGGIFLDWIHPVSIASHILGGGSWKFLEAKEFIIQPLYDKFNPTAVESRFRIKGNNFKQNSDITIRVGKGFDADFKIFRLNFDDISVDLAYLSTEEEFYTGGRGEMKIGSAQPIIPKGPLSYEMMINEVLSVASGAEPRISIEDAENIFSPVWAFHKETENTESIRDKTEMQKFIDNGLALRAG